MRFHRGGRHRAPTPDAAESSADPEGRIVSNVEQLVRVEARDRVKLGTSEHLADAMTAFSGSMMFVWLHAVWFAIWVAVNLGWLGLPAFDEFPFGLLTMVVSLEAIFLSTFVLISENRQSQQADRRAKVDLQLNMIAEQEITKLVEMVARVHEHLGLKDPDEKSVREMQRPTRVEEVADAVDAAEGNAPPDKGAVRKQK